MLVKDWMSTNVITVNVNDNMQQAISLMTDHKISMLPVLDEGKLVGIVTDRDLKRAAPSYVTLLEVKQILYHMSRVEIKAIMNIDPITVPQHYTIEETAELLLSHRISGCPVVDNDAKIVGVITKNDLFKAVISLTGLRKRGIQFGVVIEDRPGSIKEVTDIVRAHGGRLVSIMSSYDKVPEGHRSAFIRAFNINREQLPAIIKEMQAKATLIYVVDHKENARQVFAD
ncbi:MAG: CBS and ACT domain-containing protein [Thermodesulfobacteriota bacterium]